MKFLFYKEVSRHLGIITVTLKEILLTIVIININVLLTDLVSKETAVQFGRRCLPVLIEVWCLS